MISSMRSSSAAAGCGERRGSFFVIRRRNRGGIRATVANRALGLAHSRRAQVRPSRVSMAAALASGLRPVMVTCRSPVHRTVWNKGCRRSEGVCLRLPAISGIGKGQIARMVVATPRSSHARYPGRMPGPPDPGARSGGTPRRDTMAQAPPRTQDRRGVLAYLEFPEPGREGTVHHRPGLRRRTAADLARHRLPRHLPVAGSPGSPSDQTVRAGREDQSRMTDSAQVHDRYTEGSWLSREAAKLCSWAP